MTRVRLSRAAGDVEETLEGHTDWVRSVSWSPDGGRLATGSDDETVKIWALSTGASFLSARFTAAWASLDWAAELADDRVPRSARSLLP